MASDVDIVNLALGHIGNASNIASIVPGDGSIEADYASRFYPVARDEMLEMHNWGFATRRATLALLTAIPPTPWVYAYAPPADCLKPVSIAEPTVAVGVLFTESNQPNVYDVFAAQEARTADYLYETLEDGSKVIFTNVPAAELKYTRQVTDPTKFTPLFVVALSYLLASYLAGPIIKGSTGTKIALNLRQIAETLGARAQTKDSNARQADAYRDFVPQHIAIR